MIFTAVIDQKIAEAVFVTNGWWLDDLCEMCVMEYSILLVYNLTVAAGLKLKAFVRIFYAIAGVSGCPIKALTADKITQNRFIQIFLVDLLIIRCTQFL